MKRILFFILVIFVFHCLYSQELKYKLLVGTYTNTGKSQGIYAYDIDMKTEVFGQKYVAAGITNPSFLALSNDKKFLYSVCENQDGSAASAYSFDVKTSKITQINSSLTNSSGPCHISVTAKHVFTANYGGGSISVFGRNTDGSLTSVLQVIQHKGSSVNKDRQKVPHVHQTNITPNGNFLIVNDLGTDLVTTYKYDSNASVNILSPFDRIKVKLGSGPRHLTFSKDGKKVYLLQELDGTISVFQYSDSKLKLIQETTVSLKKDIVNGAADIHLSPDGKYLYATNRGTANEISCFLVKNDGTLIFKQQVSTEGIGPRNFAITPDGNYLFVANQRTDNIVIFKRNVKTGLLIDSGKRLEVGAPVCLIFY
ncbi:MAG: lactonase family protein [Paludibacter sp.]